MARSPRALSYRKGCCSRVKELSSNTLVQDKALKSAHQQDSYPRLLLFAVERVDPPGLRDPGTALLIDDPVLEDFPVALLIFKRAFEFCSQQRATERIDDLELPPELSQEPLVAFLVGAVQAHLDPAQRRVKIVMGVVALLDLNLQGKIGLDAFFPHLHPHHLWPIH